MVGWLIETLVGWILGAVAKIILFFLAVGLAGIGIAEGHSSIHKFINLFFANPIDTAISSVANSVSTAFPSSFSYKNFMTLIFILAGLIIIVNFFVGLFRNIFTDDQNTPNPVRLAFNTIKTTVFSFCSLPIMNAFIDGASFLYNAFGGRNSLQIVLGGIGQANTDALQSSWSDGLLSGLISLSGMVVNEGIAAVACVMAVIVYILLLIQVMKFMINFAERFVFLCVLYTFAPVILATGNNPTWEQTSKTFIKMFITQLILICISQIWLCFISVGLMSTGLGASMTAYSGQGIMQVNIASNSIMVLALVKIGNSLDGYLGELGMHAAAIGGGLTGAMREGMPYVKGAAGIAKSGFEGAANTRSMLGKNGKPMSYGKRFASGVLANSKGLAGFGAQKALGKLGAHDILAAAEKNRTKNQGWRDTSSLAKDSTLAKLKSLKQQGDKDATALYNKLTDPNCSSDFLTSNNNGKMQTVATIKDNKTGLQSSYVLDTETGKALNSTDSRKQDCIGLGDTSTLLNNNTIGDSNKGEPAFSYKQSDTGQNIISVENSANQSLQNLSASHNDGTCIGTDSNGTQMLETHSSFDDAGNIQTDRAEYSPLSLCSFQDGKYMYDGCEVKQLPNNLGFTYSKDGESYTINSIFVNTSASNDEVKRAYGKGSSEIISADTGFNKMNGANERQIFIKRKTNDLDDNK